MVAFVYFDETPTMRLHHNRRVLAPFWCQKIPAASGTALVHGSICALSFVDHHPRFAGRN